MQSCIKKTFHNVEVKGRVIHFITKQPLACTVTLWSNGATFGGSKRATHLGHTNTDENGFFTIKCKASKDSHYLLEIVGSPLVSQTTEPFSILVTEDKVTNLGNIERGFKNKFCKVECVPDFGRCLQIQNYNLSKNTYTTVIYGFTYFWDASIQSFPLSYTTTNCQKGVTYNETRKFHFELPFTNSDTINYTIRY